MKNATNWIVILLVIMGLSLTAQAQQGKEGSGGGYEACATYTKMAEKIIFELSLVSNLKILGSDIEKYKTILKAPLKCLPVTKLDREARSYPSQVKTELFWGKWEKLSFPQKIRLQVHELAVLAGDELDGQYHFSKDLLKFLILNSNYFSKRLRAEKVVEEGKYATLINPFYTDEDGEVYRYSAVWEKSDWSTGKLQMVSQNSVGGNLICSRFGKRIVSYVINCKEGNMRIAEYNQNIITSLKEINATKNEKQCFLESVTCKSRD